MKKQFEQLDSIKRTQLQSYLKTKSSLSEIANELGVSRQTLYRELIRNSYQKNRDYGYVHQSCSHYKECINKYRGKVFECPHKCINYDPCRPECLKKYPFVCNYCHKKNYCHLLHFFYDAEYASEKYHSNYIESRSKPYIEEDIINLVNRKVSPLVKKGQSIEAILMNHPEIHVSSSTIRRWIKLGFLKCSLSELRMTGRRKPSKCYDYSKKKDYKVLSERKLGHKYTDYRIYASSHPDALVVQLDTVIGTKDSNVSILTIHIVNYHFQFGLLLNKHSADEVNNKLNSIFVKLKEFDDAQGTVMLPTFIELLLTDNGVEFDNLFEFCEQYDFCHLFYCHPLSSFEKGACERNHELVRYVHGKGWKFDDYTQEDIDKLFSNLNSYPRKSLNNKTPYQLVLEDSRLGMEFLNLIGIYHVDCDDVTLNPSLLKQIKK